MCRRWGWEVPWWGWGWSSVALLTVSMHDVGWIASRLYCWQLSGSLWRFDLLRLVAFWLEAPPFFQVWLLLRLAWLVRNGHSWQTGGNPNKSAKVWLTDNPIRCPRSRWWEKSSWRKNKWWFSLILFIYLSNNAFYMIRIITYKYKMKHI